MIFLHLSRSVLKIELGGTDLFHNVKIQISRHFPSIFPIFHQFSMDFHLQKSMILSLKWVQRIIWGIGIPMLVFTVCLHIYIYLWETIVHDHSDSK